MLLNRRDRDLLSAVWTVNGTSSDTEWYIVISLFTNIGCTSAEMLSAS